MPSRKHHTHRPAFPNYFAEEKGPDGNAAELERQITCDLAYGARGMLKMQSYGQGGDTFDGNAYTLGSTYHSGSGVLTMYAMHPTQPADPADPTAQPEYHTTQLNSLAMTGTAIPAPKRPSGSGTQEIGQRSTGTERLRVRMR